MLPSTWFCISQPNGDFVCVARGLFFEGNILTYDPASNEMEWIPMQGTAEDLSQAEDASTRELSNMVPLDSAEEAQRLDRFGEQKSKSRVESDAKEDPTDAPHKECMDQGYEGGSDYEGSNSTPDDLCSPVSSQGSACHMCCYSSGHCPGGVSWVDQCLSKGEGDPMSGGEEDTSHVAIDEDRGEETPTPQTTLQDEQGPAKELQEEMSGEPDRMAGVVGASPTNSQDEVTVHMTEEEIRDLG